jgi:hypothetical protein
MRDDHGNNRRPNSDIVARSRSNADLYGNIFIHSNSDERSKRLNEVTDANNIP